MTKYCPKHPNQKLIQLFSSWACDVCDGKAGTAAESVPVGLSRSDHRHTPFWVSKLPIYSSNRPAGTACIMGNEMFYWDGKNWRDVDGVIY